MPKEPHSKFERERALSVPKNTGPRGLYKTGAARLILLRPPAFATGSLSVHPLFNLEGQISLPAANAILIKIHGNGIARQMLK
jgi:hypothetical protein